MKTSSSLALALLALPLSLTGCDEPAPSHASPESIAQQAAEIMGSEMPDLGSNELADRLEAVNEMMISGVYDSATDEVIWLWHNMGVISEDMAPLRASILIVYMVDLIEIEPTAYERFSELRDEIEEFIGVEFDDSDTIDEWLALNELLEDYDRVVVWYDSVKAEEDAQDDLQRLAYRIEPFLIRAERWADLGSIYPLPLDTALRTLSRLVVDADELGVDPLDRQFNETDFQDRAAMKTTALLAAGRLADAEVVADFAFKTLDDDTNRIAIVSFGVDVGIAHPLQLEWLKGVKNKRDHAEALERQVQQLLAG